MKQINFFVLLAVAFFMAQFKATAQDLPESSTAATGNFYRDNPKPKYGVFINGGVTFPYTDVKSPNHTSYVFGVEGQYRPVYFLDVLVDFQLGELKAGDTKSDKNLYFKNQIFNAVLLARFYPLKFMNNIPLSSPMYYVSGLYAGVGVGMVRSKVEANLMTDPDFEYIGNYTGSDVLLPVDIGATIPIAQLPKQQQISINVDYRFNFTLGDKLDGYASPRNVNHNNDVFNTLTVGIGYNF